MTDPSMKNYEYSESSDKNEYAKVAYQNNQRTEIVFEANGEMVGSGLVGDVEE